MGRAIGNLVDEPAQIAPVIASMGNGGPARNADAGALRKKRALVICTHLRPGRVKRSSHYVMQPIAGLHVASQIDPAQFEITLHHEDWHGPYDPACARGYDLVFLSGLQVDFDRMRQLSYFFRRAGAKVVAGGSICTVFPEFASQFFDAVCAGGVDCVPDVVADFLKGRLKPIYRSPIASISDYRIDHGIFARSKILPTVHLFETSRGCSFRCSFCVIPSEVGAHATYDVDALSRAIDDSIANSPRFSFRRLYPLIIFHDNNFSDNRAHMMRVCEMLKRHPRVRGWAALVTQNMLHDRALIAKLADAKCYSLFVGLESFDREMLRRYRKTQNLSRHNVIDDIAFAESSGIGIGYGYLFDPRMQTASQMEEQIGMIARNPKLPMPIYLSVVAPLAGTQSFWEDLKNGDLAANLRLRDLDGETICYSKLADREAALVSFSEKMFRRPWTVAPRRTVLWKTIRRIVRTRSLNPIRWYTIGAANLHAFVWSSVSTSAARTYLAGSDVLDPQYFERPDDLSEADCARYFDPIFLTDSEGGPCEWLKRYVPASGVAVHLSLEREAERETA
jgi:radical SAM superfamily enzyme YgiQ (UPF0313 family)